MRGLLLYIDADEIGDSCATVPGNEQQKHESKQETELTVHQNKSIKPEHYHHSSFNMTFYMLQNTAKVRN